MQEIDPSIAYHTCHYWISKPLHEEALTDLFPESEDDWYFLGVLCSFKCSPNKSPFKLSPSTDLQIIKYIHSKYKNFCKEELLNNKIASKPLVNLISNLVKNLVLEVSNDIDMEETHFNEFKRGFLYGSIVNISEDSIRIPINTFFLEKFIKENQPLVYRKYYKSYLFSSYSKSKLEKLIFPS